jgi:hypothetical protein
VAARVAIAVCIIVGAVVGDRATQKPATRATEQRRLLIRSGTLFTKEGVPIALSAFDSEIQSDQLSGDGAASQKKVEDVFVRSGHAFVRAKDLGALLRSHIKNDKITDLNVETIGSEVKITGHLKKAFPVHFEIKGPVSLTSSGLIDMHESSMKVDKLPMKALSDMLGIGPAQEMNSNSHNGIKATKDDILLDPSELWGMSVHGKLTSVKLVNNGLMLVYGAPAKTIASR